eukprot:s4081_g4.t1
MGGVTGVSEGMTLGQLSAVKSDGRRRLDSRVAATPIADGIRSALWDIHPCISSTPQCRRRRVDDATPRSSCGQKSALDFVI